jgi:5'-nucleotidase
MSPENRNSEGECYQVNSKVQAMYSDDEHKLVSISIDSKKVEDDSSYRICLQGYHANNSASYLNISENELLESGKTKVVSTSAKEVLEEYLRNHQNIERTVEGRFQYL